MKRSSPYVIGLTGGIASGKSTLSAALRRAGAPVIDADKISHELTIVDGLALPALRDAFGESIFTGVALDRRALAERVFGDEEALERLNGIMHPLIMEEIQRQMESLQNEPAVIWDIPLLFETGWDKRCDEVWCAWAPVWIQLRRLIKRDGLTLREARQRIKSQMPGREKRRLADHAIATTGTKADSARHALKLWNAALKKVNSAQQ